jgi:hypothetical protein
MVDAERPAFLEALDAACTMLSRGRYKPDAMSAALWFRALAPYQWTEIRQALSAHIRDPERGRYVPTPADIIAQLEGSAAHDGRPEADEAWAIAIKSIDEEATVVWTPEIRNAFEVARPVLELRDEVGARLAFREAYERAVGVSRTAKRQAEWLVSVGFDTGKRRQAIAAASIGRLPAEDLLRLPAPDPEPTSLLAMAPPHLRERLQALRDRLAARAPLQQDGVDTSERDRLQAAKDRAAAAVADYAEAHGIYLVPDAP